MGDIRIMCTEGYTDNSEGYYVRNPSHTGWVWICTHEE